MMIYETFSPEETFEVARNLSGRVSPGNILCLNGDLGAGKTVFAKGLAHGLGIRETVNSPTFTILKIYEGGRMPLYHFDVYRLEDATELYETGYEDYFYGEGVCLIEWPERVRELIPEGSVEIRITKDFSRGDDFRKIEIDL